MPRPANPIAPQPQPAAKSSAPRGAARRDCIVDAALVVIGRVGPDALTHRLVAAEAGVPLAATTYWFASKEALILEAFAHAARRDIAQLERETAEAADWTSADAAGHLARSMRASLTEHRTRTVVDYGLWVEAARRPALRPVADAWSRACQAFFATILEAIGGRRSEHDARLLTAAFDGLLMDQLASDHPDDEARLTAVLERLLGAFAG
ncbi:MAG: TetR family transcriptional regulator [Conexibacter sp.]|jgi:DNA-binding transcriptional regulator YbjK|nr:TetR family transcriptional regulator [Conexibacter sp.]